MANLLAEGSNWLNLDDSSLPSSTWNGATFSGSFSDVTEHVVAISYQGTISPGDTFNGTVTFNSMTPPVSAGIVIGSQSDNESNFGQVNFAPNVPMAFSFDATLGNTLKITTPSSGDFAQSFYGLSFTITPVTPNCDEIGNATKIVASAWDRTRVFLGRLIRGEKRCLLVDFNGAIDKSRTILGVKWQCGQTYIAIMSNARIQSDLRSTAVDVQANYPNDTMFKCTAYLDNGERYVQTIRMSVDDTYWFDGDTVQQNGPTVLTVGNIG